MNVSYSTPCRFEMKLSLKTLLDEHPHKAYLLYRLTLTKIASFVSVPPYTSSSFKARLHDQNLNNNNYEL